MQDRKLPFKQAVLRQRIMRGLLFCTILSSMCGADAAAADLFASPTGDDRNPGTRRKPFASLERAREEVRLLRKKGLPEGGVTVWLGPGTYERQSTFVLGAEDSGTKDAPVVWRGTGARDVRVMGGRRIPFSAFKPVSDKSVLDRLPEEARGHVLVCELKALGITDLPAMEPFGFGRKTVPAPPEVIFNDKRMQVARWPNEGFASYGKILDRGSRPRWNEKPDRGGCFQYIGDRPARWTTAEDLLLHGYWAYMWSDEALPVESIDTKKREIMLAQPHRYGLDPHGAANKERPFYALNLLEELDTPGEYFVDRKAGRLYLYPPAPVPQSRIVITLLSAPLIRLENASHITVRGLTVEAGRGNGIEIRGGSHNLVAGCTLRNLGMWAVSVGHKGIHDYEAGTHNGVQGCEIYWTGCGGVILAGGDRRTLTPGRNFVVNCDIHHVALRYKQYQPPVHLCGVGNRVAHCHLHHVPQVAIWFDSNDDVIELNEIDHCCLESNDAAAIEKGRDPSMQGLVIRHNFFHHNGGRPWTSDIFLDDGLSGITTTGNVFYGIPPRGALFIHAGMYNTFRNNIVVNGKCAVQMSAWNQSRWNEYFTGKYDDGSVRKRVYEDIDIRKSPYITRYANLESIRKYDPKTNVAEHNLLVNCPGAARGGPIAKNNVLVKEDPGFVNMAKLDFRLRPDAAVLKKLPGLTAIPFEQMGLRPDEYGRVTKTLFLSEVIRGRDSAREVEVSIRGMSELRLSVWNGGDHIHADHADWAEAELVTRDGTVTRLSSLSPFLRSGYGGGEFRRDVSRLNKPLTIKSAAFKHGISTHAHSYLVFRFEPAYETFRARIGVDDSAGGRGSVRFKLEGVRGR